MMMINRRMMMMLPRIDRYHCNIIIATDRIAVRKSSSSFIIHSSFHNHNNNKKMMMMMMMIGQVKSFSNKVLQQPHPIRSLQFDNIIELQHKIVEAYADNPMLGMMMYCRRLLWFSYCSGDDNCYDDDGYDDDDDEMDDDHDGMNDVGGMDDDDADVFNSLIKQSIDRSNRNLSQRRWS